MEFCLPFILDRLAAHRRESDGPLVVGLQGIQGSGKSTLVNALHSTLTQPPYSLPTAVVSIDDIYLTHDAQKKLSASHPTNPLLKHRGQPSTHDLPLGLELLSAFSNRDPRIRIPVYDKSAFQGQGDRADPSTWPVVNGKDIEVVLFEGWCVGFRPLSDEELERKWTAARGGEQRGEDGGRLGKLKLEDVRTVNTALRQYNDFTNQFDAFVHLDAENPQYVYDWRLQQETALRAAKGTGMTDQEVVEFVHGYYPSYELYLDDLRSGIYKNEKGKHLHIILGKDRKVIQSVVI